MLNRLLDLLRADETDPAAITPELAAAALLFEVVWADHNVGTEELQAMSSALADQFSLSPSRVAQILEETQADHEDSVGVQTFTRTLNEQLSQAQKVDVVRAMWRVAFADNKLQAFEEHTIRRIADLLYVSHKDFIAAKLAARDNRDL